MTSVKQTAANRRNAQKSSGPKTVEGKAVTSRNATKHGLLSKEIIIRGEDPADLQVLRQSLQIELQPKGALEDELVDQITMYLWRLRRNRAVETSVFAMGIITDSLDTPRSRELNYRIYLAKRMRENSMPDNRLASYGGLEKSAALAFVKEQANSDDRSAKTSREDPSSSPGGHAEQLGRVFRRASGPLANLQRYRVATERSLHRALRELERLQAARSGSSAHPTTLDFKATDGTSTE